MDKQTEYETLRGEIICSTQVVKNYRSSLCCYVFQKPKVFRMLQFLHLNNWL